MESVRVELDGHMYWDIKEEITHRESRQIAKVSQTASFKLLKELEKDGINVNKAITEDTTAKKNGASPVGLMPEAEDLLLLLGTVGWSFPEPINAETVVSRGRRHVKKVLATMIKQYELGETEEQRNFTVAS